MGMMVKVEVVHSFINNNKDEDNGMRDKFTREIVIVKVTIREGEKEMLLGWIKNNN